MPPGDNSDLAKAIWALKADLDSRHTENADRQTDTDRKINEISDRLQKVLTSAFPAGDADSHRLYHESLIARNLAREQLWKEVRAKLITHGLLTAGGFLALAVLLYVKNALKS
jgi:hypothetical protein